MTIVNPDYEFVVEEGKVYKIQATRTTNVAPHLQITGDGTVDILGSIQTPESADDPILTSGPNDVDLTGFIQLEPGVPNYIKFVENQAGSRVITLSGFEKPEEVEFT